VRSWIDHSGEVVWEPAPSLMAQLIEAGQPFWLDIENPTDEIVDQGWPAFLVLGVGLSVACVAVTVFILSRRGWN
jgi:hypothetical protein